MTTAPVVLSGGEAPNKGTLMPSSSKETSIAIGAEQLVHNYIFLRGGATACPKHCEGVLGSDYAFGGTFGPSIADQKNCGSAYGQSCCIYRQFTDDLFAWAALLGAGHVSL